MNRSRLGALALATALCAAAPHVARADASTDRQIAAESLFQEAKTLIDQGRFAEACPKLLESNRLSPGIGVLLNLGGCYEKTGQVASAWATLNEAADRAKASQDPAREKLARDRAEALAPRLPRLSIEPSAIVEGLVIERDGTPLVASLVGRPVPVDPGEHEIKVTLPGREPRSTRVTLREGETQHVRLELPAAAPSAPKPHAHKRPTRSANGRVVAGITTAAIGVAGVIVGAGTGGAALAKMGQARSLCAHPDQGTGCSGRALELQDASRPLATVSTIGFVVGGAALATGLTVWLTAPPSDEAKPTAHLDVGPSGLSIGGAF